MKHRKVIIEEGDGKSEEEEKEREKTGENENSMESMEIIDGEAKIQVSRVLCHQNPSSLVEKY